MDPNSGKLVLEEQLTEKQKKTFIPVKRDLTEREKMEMQIALFSPCACGSGIKFKFCCYKKH